MLVNNHGRDKVPSNKTDFPINILFNPKKI